MQAVPCEEAVLQPAHADLFEAARLQSIEVLGDHRVLLGGEPLVTAGDVAPVELVVADVAGGRADGVAVKTVGAAIAVDVVDVDDRDIRPGGRQPLSVQSRRHACTTERERDRRQPGDQPAVQRVKHGRSSCRTSTSAGSCGRRSGLKELRSTIETYLRTRSRR